MFFLAIALGLFMMVVGGIVVYGGMFAVGITLIVAGIIEIIAILYLYHQKGTLKKEIDKCEPNCDSDDCSVWNWFLAWQCIDTAGDCVLLTAVSECQMPECPSIECPDMPDCDCSCD
ncbi:hypothetical protein D3C81_384760 [compost metagenome]